MSKQNQTVSLHTEESELTLKKQAGGSTLTEQTQKQLRELKQWREDLRSELKDVFAGQPLCQHVLKQKE